MSSSRQVKNKPASATLESTPKRPARAPVQDHKRDPDDETELDADGDRDSPPGSPASTPIPQTSSVTLANATKPSDLPDQTESFIDLYIKRATTKISGHWFKATRKMKNVIVLEHQMENSLKPSDLNPLDTMKSQPMTVPDITAPLYQALNEKEAAIFSTAGNAVMTTRLDTHRKASELLRNTTIAETTDEAITQHYLDQLAKNNSFPKNTAEYRAAAKPTTIAYICHTLQDLVTTESAKFATATTTQRTATAANHTSYMYRLNHPNNQNQTGKRKTHPNLVITQDIINTTNTKRDTTIPTYFNRVEPPTKAQRRRIDAPAQAPPTNTAPAAPTKKTLTAAQQLEADAHAYRALLARQNTINQFPHSHQGYYLPGAILPNGIQPHMHEQSFAPYPYRTPDNYHTNHHANHPY